MNSTELLNEIKNQLELLKHKGYDKNSFKSGYLLGYAKALQLQQAGVMRSNCIDESPEPRVNINKFDENDYYDGKFLK